MRFLAASTLFLATLFAGETPVWVAKSNKNAQLLLNVTARYSPESASSMGIPGFDDKISVPTADLREREQRDLKDVGRQLEARLASEPDPLVKQDLTILIKEVRREVQDSEVEQRLMLPYSNVARTIFSGIRTLLDDQVEAQRRPAALVRLRRYTGSEQGYKPFTVLAEEQFRDKLSQPGLIGPSRQELEKDLADTAAFVTGIGLLFEKYKLDGYQESFAKLKTQLDQYADFVRKDVVPKARTDFRLPPELYTRALADYGVDYTPDELTKLAHQKFDEWQREMQELSARIASERHLESADYRDVILALKKEQIPGNEIMPHYQRRLAEIEDILRREHLVSLPNRPAIIRLASAAETAAQPAPHMDPPRMLNNHGERGEFVLPRETNGQGGKALKYDDFTFSAASWTLTAHEARPGHELQFDAMVERGVSQARAIFAFNSVNVEGWGLYSEWFMFPYMPDEAKLISLQFRLLRAARAFLDPELQQGKITPDQAMQVLKHDVVTSEAFATEEVERFTFRAPGQAVSYFDGLMRLLNLRADVEKATGTRFDAQRFHDFILSEGLLPPDLLRKAVAAEFMSENGNTQAVSNGRIAATTN